MNTNVRDLSISKKIIAVLLAMFVFVGVVAVRAQDSETGSTPAPTTSKTLTDNGDGTYNLNLSVTGTASSSITTTKSDVIIIFDTSGSMDDGMNGRSTTENSAKRMTIAKNAVNSLAQTLLDINTTENPDLVRLSLVPFASVASSSVSSFTTDLNTFQTRVNNLSANGGTNWEDALQTANSLSTRSDASVHVIFVSDGNPTFRMTKNGSSIQIWGDYESHRSGGKRYYGTGNSDPNSNNYNMAVNAARNIVNAGKNFHSIGVSNDATRMQGLATAVGQSENYYLATDTASLNSAFANIASQITNATNFQDVVIHDGITNATSSVVLADGATASDYTYTITSPSGNRYELKLDDNGRITSINGGTSAVTLTDSVSNSYTLRVGDAFPAAGKNGNGVEWDLSAIGRLLNGYQYTVSFTVWPSQDAYDTLADLLNGQVSWDDVDQTQYTRTDNGDGTYSYGLRTNTSATVDYKHVQEVDGQQTVVTPGTSTFSDVPSIALTSTTMSVNKQWNGDMPNNPDASVTFELYVDGVASGTTVVLNNANNWQSDVYIAPGIRVGDEILETGHDYTLEEIYTSGFQEYRYEFESQTQHPMIVDGTLTLSNNANSLVGSNNRKSNLNITKTVNDLSTDLSADPDELFTFEIEVTDNLGDDVFFSIGDGAGHVVSETTRVTGATAEIQSGTLTGYYFMPSGSTATVQIKRSENIYFTNLAKDSTYTITEVNLPKGYENTSISGNGAGNVTLPSASGTISASNTTYNVNYTNQYSVAVVDGNDAISVTKSVSGRNAFEQFAFELIPSSDTQSAIDAGDIVVAENANQVVTSTDGFIVKDASETVSFGKYSFYAEGTYTFTIDETTTTTAPGWTYDSKTEIVTVNVTNNNGALVATITNNNPTFTNVYTANPVNAQISVEKILNVTSGNPDSIAGQFTFTLIGVDGAPMPTGTNTLTNPDMNGGVASFGEITYTEEGTYYYDITESGSVSGITNDSASTKRISVVVTDNGQGQLVANVNGGNNVTFTNTYETNQVTVSIPVTKNLSAATGLNVPDISGKFTFALVAVDGAPMPTNGTSVTNPDANGGTAYFGSIVFTQEGTYYYDITESGFVSGVTNDAVSTKRISVVVTDNGQGVLSATVNNGATVTFANTYQASPTTAAIRVTKNLNVRTGLTAPDITGAYTFTLKDSNGTVIETVTNPPADGGSTSFNAITYTEPGTYTYTVEESGNVAGITNDQYSSKTVTINVTDNGQGQLVANDGSVTFTNSYDVSSIGVVIPVRKVVSAEAGLTPPNILGQYEFNITAVGGAPLTSTTGGTISQSVVNSSSNDMAFEEIVFNTPGTYEYIIREHNVNPSGVPGITNDPQASTGKKIIVVVTDNSDGTLSTYITDENGNDEQITFTNTYSVSSTTANISVEKILSSDEGLNVPDIKNAFTFELAAIDNAPLPDNLTITNPDITGGIASFGNITFDQPGTYKYTVTETGSVLGVENDSESTKTIEIVVTDNSNGTLTATVNDGQNVTFTNTYKVAPITVTPVVEKVMEIPNGHEGPEYVEEAFTFTISGEDGAPLPTNTTATVSSEGGAVNFGEIDFTKPGRYTYTVTESGTLPGVVNDSMASAGKTIFIIVEDDGEGNLVVTETTNSDNEPLVFTNVYEVDEIDGSITDYVEINKVLEGRTLRDGEFSFAFRGDNVEIIAANDVDGKVVFDAITFDTPGTYTFTISEVIGNSSGIAYDQTIYTVIVEVEDNRDGTLSLSWVVSDDEITFENIYNEPEKPDVPDTSDDDPKKPVVPDTSDHTNTTAWVLLFTSMFVLVGALWILIRDRRKKNHN